MKKLPARRLILPFSTYHWKHLLDSDIAEGRHEYWIRLYWSATLPVQTPPRDISETSRSRRHILSASWTKIPYKYAIPVGCGPISDDRQSYPSHPWIVKITNATVYHQRHLEGYPIYFKSLCLSKWWLHTRLYPNGHFQEFDGQFGTICFVAEEWHHIVIYTCICLLKSTNRI